MIQLFNSKEVNINQSFSEWNERDLMLYKKIKEFIDELVDNELVKYKIKGKGKRKNYWWVI